MESFPLLQSATRKWLQAIALSLFLGVAIVIAMPWKQLFRLALANDQYSHILVVPFVTVAFIASDRRTVFNEMNSYTIGIVPAALALFLMLRFSKSIAGEYYLFFTTFCSVVFIITTFLLCFGRIAFARALFPLCFLLLMVPVPDLWIKPIIRLLQEGSAALTAILFRIIHLPALRQGLSFSLPGFDIQIAEQCSGIRSSIALCICSSVLGRLLLRTIWRRIALVLLTVPLVILKNALRIVTIASLGVYVNQGFLHGSLHHYSGLPFSLVELAMILPLLMRWRRVESQT